MLQDALQAELLLLSLLSWRHGLEAADFSHAACKSGVALAFNQWQQQMRVKKTHSYFPNQTFCERHNCSQDDRVVGSKAASAAVSRLANSKSFHADNARFFWRGRLTARFRLAGKASTG